jgi:hypothetical protein
VDFPTTAYAWPQIISNGQNNGAIAAAGSVEEPITNLVAAGAGPKGARDLRPLTSLMLTYLQSTPVPSRQP